MKKFFAVLSILFTFAFFNAGIAVGDEIRLKTGRVIEGEIVDETESTVKINLGYGIVGFSRSRIEEIIRSTDEEQDELDKKLEQKRQEAVSAAKKNEQLYDKQSKREALISKQKDKQSQIRLKREEILQRRKEQIERMREEREKGIEAIQQGEADINPNIPPPPALPGMEQETPDIPMESSPDIPHVEPEKLLPEAAEQTEPEPTDEGSGGRRIHRLRNR